VAVQLVHADRTVTTEEQTFLNELAQSVDLPQGKAQAVMDAIMALNHDSLAS
jgi:hypothetical protein